MVRAEAELDAEVQAWLDQAAAADAFEDAEHGADRRGDETPDWMADKRRRLGIGAGRDLDCSCLQGWHDGAADLLHRGALRIRAHVQCRDHAASSIRQRHRYAGNTFLDLAFHIGPTLRPDIGEPRAKHGRISYRELREPAEGRCPEVILERGQRQRGEQHPSHAGHVCRQPAAGRDADVQRPSGRDAQHIHHLRTVQHTGRRRLVQPVGDELQHGARRIPNGTFAAALCQVEHPCREEEIADTVAVGEHAPSRLTLATKERAAQTIGAA